MLKNFIKNYLRKTTKKTVGGGEERSYNYGYLTIILSIVLIILFVLTHKIKYDHYYALVDSDSASEMVLSSILAQNNQVITDSWYYSTELRFLNTQLIYSLFFRIFTDWKIIRIASIILMHIILILSVYYFCYQVLPINKKQKRLIATMAGIWYMCPLYMDWFNLINFACPYLPYICISLISIGLVYHYNKNGTKSILLLSLVISLLSTISGLRQLFITYIPIFLSIYLLCLDKKASNIKLIIKKRSRYLIIISLNLAFAIIGYLINKYLSQTLYFQSQEKFEFTMINFNRISLIINDILNIFGYKQGIVNRISVFANSYCGLIVLLIITSLSIFFNNKQKFEIRLFACFNLINIVLFLLLYAMTNFSYSGRYFVPYLGTLIIQAVYYLVFLIHDSKIAVINTITIVFIFLTLYRGHITFNEVKQLNRANAKQLYQIANYLCKNGYHNGYATFWNSNVITEYSNGTIEVYTLENFLTPQLDNLYKWLQKTEHWHKHPQGKIFIIFNDDEKNEFHWKDNLNEKNIIYSDGIYEVYGYDSIEDIKSILMKENNNQIEE